jgi:hypothetical protein
MVGNRTASVQEVWEAAEILTGMHNNTTSPMACDEDAYSEPWSPHNMEEQAYQQCWGRPAAAAAGKSRAKRPAAKKAAPKRRQNQEKLHVGSLL